MTPGPWGLCGVSRVVPSGRAVGVVAWGSRTDDERNHACAIATGGFEAFDQLLDLPDLNVLLRIVGLRLLGRHGGGWWWTSVGRQEAGGELRRGALRDFLDQRGARCDEGCSRRAAVGRGEARAMRQSTPGRAVVGVKGSSGRDSRSRASVSLAGVEVNLFRSAGARL